jgi:hypothetical protein
MHLHVAAAMHHCGLPCWDEQVINQYSVPNTSAADTCISAEPVSGIGYTRLTLNSPCSLLEGFALVSLATAGLVSHHTSAKSQATRAGKCVGVAQSGGGQAKRVTPCGIAKDDFMMNTI